MKKAIIFGYTMDMGGAERALLNIINVLKKHYQIDLVLLKKTGVLINEIPKEVNVKSIRQDNFFSTFHYIFFRYVPFIRKRIINNLTKEHYALAIAFMEGRAATWLIDMKQSCKKVAWIHNDVSKFNIGISDKEIKKTYSKLDNIIIVSKHSQKSFCEKYHISKEKTQVIYNLIDEDAILKNANNQQITKNKFTFINVAKMRPQKRHDRLIDAVKILKDKGYDFELWLVGNGELEEQIKAQVKSLKLEDTVKLLGLITNPYPYIKTADYFVMSSDHEGYPLSLLEALLLKTPVITTNVSGAKEILEDDKYGIICDIDTNSLANAMERVLNNENIKYIKENLKNYKGSNKEIIKQLFKLFKINSK